MPFEQTRDELFGAATKRDAVEPTAAGISPVLSYYDLLEAAREAEGEGESGLAYIEEHVLGTELGASPPPDVAPVIGFDVWTEEERVRLLSRMTAELIYDVLAHVVAPKWWKQEPEVLLEELITQGVIPDGLGITKLRALQSLLRARQGYCSFYNNPETFPFLCAALSGRALSFDLPLIPTPEEVGVSIQTMLELRPNPFDLDVQGMIAACCLNDGVWCLPGVLAPFQEHVLRIAMGADLPVDEKRLEGVQYRVAMFLEDPSSLPASDDLDEDDGQALRVIALNHVLDHAAWRADKERAQFRDSLKGA